MRVSPTDPVGRASIVQRIASSALPPDPKPRNIGSRLPNRPATRQKLARVLLAVALLTGCGADRREPGSARREAQSDWFTSRAEDIGLDFVHFNGMSGKFYFPEMIPPGVALFDYDNDGDLDVFLVQGQMLGEAARSENVVLVYCWPDGLGAPRARPPERSGDRGAPRAAAKGGSRGRSPPDPVRSSAGSQARKAADRVSGLAPASWLRTRC
jgi:hypothetical protein